MNTRQLRHFLAVVDLGTLSAAAEAVHLSQPALSRSLRALEDELRVTLFDREERRLKPTPYAMEYAQLARRMVSDEKEGARMLALMLVEARSTAPHPLAPIAEKVSSTRIGLRNARVEFRSRNSTRARSECGLLHWQRPM